MISECLGSVCGSGFDSGRFGSVQLQFGSVRIGSRSGSVRFESLSSSVRIGSVQIRFGSLRSVRFGGLLVNGQFKYAGMLKWAFCLLVQI